VCPLRLSGAPAPALGDGMGAPETGCDDTVSARHDITLRPLHLGTLGLAKQLIDTPRASAKSTHPWFAGWALYSAPEDRLSKLCCHAQLARRRD
jgi:hypothetical protein